MKTLIKEQKIGGKWWKTPTGFLVLADWSTSYCVYPHSHRKMYAECLSKLFTKPIASIYIDRPKDFRIHIS